MTGRSLGHRAPLLWLVLPLAAGLVAGHAGEAVPTGWLLAGAALAAGVAAWAGWRAHPAWGPMVCVAMVLAGDGYYALRRNRLAAWEGLPPREVRLSLRVDRTFPQADVRRFTGLATVRTAEAPLGDLRGQHLYFSLTLKKGETAPIRSAVIAAAGVLAPLSRDPAADSFDGYLAGAGMNFRLSRGRVVAVEQPATAYHRFLEHAAARLNEWLSIGVVTKRPDLTAVYRAMMLGQKHDLSDEQNAVFMRSGTMHLFAINGLHIGVVAMALHALLGVLRCPRPAAAVITLAALWLDVDTTGATPSAVRAFILVACYEASVVIRRPANGIAALATAALIVLLLEPMALFSASLQMSYGVVLAILCYGLPLAEWATDRLAPFKLQPGVTWTWWQRAWAATLRWLWPALGIGIAAALVSTVSGPQFFHVWAPGGFVANLALVPLATLVIVAGFSSIVAGLVGATFLGSVFNHAAIMLLIAIDRLIRAGVHVPGTWWEAHWRIPWMASLALVALLASILAGYAAGWRKERGGWWPPMIIATVALVAGVKFG
jgi:competence protein ComEC